ncbi:MAG: glycosyltransferase family 4 protein [Flavobacteriales bacterium]|jgi:glycosyltransferase involved in cell wall biosynthesis|nr:glycosyltransferase family 4 protein [Flavobacteriales bacterium]MBK6551452.1 glycosyltransferase family 4 protein [Flavobacteriales bacterium]MBK6882851.1 glycosyltransferase family 4 protein [Flavobacteriales bacterium]MBK7101844.1 glycosyltransferase family 4 protein [Flavobacteriales bacterium]MBK7483755.1 glycosyltransferase family 4 protein [Flavobacteriales bacterium]
MKKQRIHVLHTFANNDGIPYMTWFMERARQEGDLHFTIVLLYPTRPAMLEEIKAFGFDGIWIPFDDRARKLGMLKALPRLWWIMMRLRPRVVHCHLFDDTLPGVIAAFLAGIKTRLVSRQDTGFHLNYAPKWVIMDRFIARLATRVATISHSARQLIIEREGTPAEKVQMIHNGIPPDRYLQVDLEVQERLRTRFQLHDAYPIIGTVARFIEWKGYRHIVDAAALIVKNHPKARFLFCGSGPQLEEVRGWVEQAGLNEHVIITGWVARDEMPSLYRLLNIYLHAADHEPFGLVYPEAMMSGVPVVSTATGAVLDAIQDPSEGILVPERSGRALADGVEQALRAGPERIGERGREVALRMFTFDHMWAGYSGIYRQAAPSNG